MLDPGIGFGKTAAHNLELLRRLDELADAGPAARDRHLAQELPRAHRGRAAASRSRWRPQRLAGTIATNVLALERGASMFRVHDVAPVARCAGGGGCYVGRAMDGEGRRRGATS